MVVTNEQLLVTKIVIILKNHSKCLQNNFHSDDVIFRIEYVSHTCYGGDHVCHRSIFIKVNNDLFINFEPGFVPQEYGR